MIFICLCLTLGVFTLIKPKREFSHRENRKLAQAPKLSETSFFDGSFQDGFSSFFSDQFGGRDMWGQVNLSFKKAIGQHENGGVYLGKEGHLYLIPENPDKKSIDENLKAVNSFSEQFPKVNSYMCIVPNAVTVQSQFLPPDAPTVDQNKLLGYIKTGLDGTSFIDVSAPLKQKNNEYIFFLTDHHWTSLGAKTAFEEIAVKMKLKNVVSDYKILTVSENFTGTLSSKSSSFEVKDTVDVYLPETDIIYNVDYCNGEQKTRSVFKSEALKGNDKYTVFFGGNHPRIDIKTTAKTGRKLLVFKDSYFNSLAQFMWPYFDTITIIDPRYYYEYAGFIIRQQGITDVLYLYNADTFGTDKSLYAVLEAPKETEK